MDENKNILDILLDDENDEPIVLYNEDNEEVLFEQVAIIPLGEDELYAVLKPVNPEQLDIPDDEAMVFAVAFDESGEPYLVVETDDEKAEEVFEAYYRLLDEYDE